MTSLNSIVQQRGSVTFPLFMGERIYMREFTKKRGLPKHLSRWQETVDMMLDGIDLTDEKIYLMIDQGIVKAGSTHRRGGMHVDGYWNPEIQAHGGGSGGGHGSSPWRPAGHGGTPSRHSGISTAASYQGSHGGHGSYSIDAEGLILASDVSSCRALIGQYDGEFVNGGDMSHLDLSNLDEVTLEANRVYAGTAIGTLHESLPLLKDTQRTLVRLNVKGWEPDA